MSPPARCSLLALRTVLLVLAVSAGTTALVRFAPGFFSDEREMDARYAQSAQNDLKAEQARSQSATLLVANELGRWARGDFGESRQYGIPVVALIGPRIEVSASLLLRGVVFGWLIAIGAALPISALRRGGELWGVPFTLLLATPTAAMATLCILAGTGGPVLVLMLLVASRDFKFLRRILREGWASPHLLAGRAHGLGLLALLRLHLAPKVARRLGSLATLSIVTALAALIPVEVLFDVPGVGQLAWSAVLNRDLPVLVAVSMLMATVVAGAGLLSTANARLEPA